MMSSQLKNQNFSDWLILFYRNALEIKGTANTTSFASNFIH